MLKVTKFGGSSMADAGQYQKVRDILLADPERRVVVVSAAGKRFSKDHKITDLLYLCHAHTQYGVPCDPIFEMITSRYIEIREELGITLDLVTSSASHFSCTTVPCCQMFNGLKLLFYTLPSSVSLFEGKG